MGIRVKMHEPMGTFLIHITTAANPSHGKTHPFLQRHCSVLRVICKTWFWVNQKEL